MIRRGCTKISVGAVLLICACYAFQDVEAQAPARDTHISSVLKVESFDWYAASEVAKPAIRHYPFSVPEGKLADPQTVNDEQKRQSEKFIYQIVVRNLGKNEVSHVAWRYEFLDPDNRQLLASFSFDTDVRIKPGKRKTIYEEKSSPPTLTIDVRQMSLDRRSPYKETATVIGVSFRK